MILMIDTLSDRYEIKSDNYFKAGPQSMSNYLLMESSYRAT